MNAGSLLLLVKELAIVWIHVWLCTFRHTRTYVYIWSGHTTDEDIVSHGPVEEPEKDKRSLRTPESPEEDEDTDTDDGPFGGDEDVDGSLSQ